MEVIRSARIPVFKFVHSPTDLHCDITCQKLGVYNSKLLSSLIAVDAVLFRPFFFLLKLWASSHCLIDSPNNGLSSYGLNLLALFYLQQLKLLPSVEELQMDVPVKLCRYWNVNFTDPKPLNPAANRPKFQHLLIGFFQFYKSLDSSQNVISPFKGQLIPVSDFSARGKSAPLRKSMALYTENLHAHKLVPLKISQLNIQEPFELNQNVSFGFLYLERFQSLCRDAELICQQMTPTSPISSLFGDFEKSVATSATHSSAAKKETINKVIIKTGREAAPSPSNSSVSVLFQLRPNDPGVITRALTDQAIDASGVFLGRLLSFSYGIAIVETSSEPAAEDGSPKAKKFRSNYDEQQTAEEDMVMQWSRPYDISFLFDVFHPLRETLANEIRSRQVESEVAKSLLDRERQITSILATRKLDGCASAFYSPGGVAIQCHLDRSREESLVIVKLKNNQKTLQPVAFRQLAEGLGRYVAPILELFLTQNLFPFKVYRTLEWDYD